MLRRALISTMVALTFGAASVMAHCPAESVGDSTSLSPDTTAVEHKSDNSVSRNLFVEWGGPSYGFGIGYDQRFKPTSVFGFRAGLSYTSGSFDDSGWFGAHRMPYTEVDYKGVAIPLEINAIIGKRASKLELGIGATPCLLHRHEVKHFDRNPDMPATAEDGLRKNFIKDGFRINFFGTLNIGYRLQRKSGFFLRTGMTILMGDIKYSPLDGSYPTFYISLGYTIK